MASPTRNTRKVLTSGNMQTKHVIKTLKENIAAFFKDKKNANRLIDVIYTFQNDDPDILLACLKSIPKIFIQAITNQDMFLKKPLTEEELEDCSKADRYKMWLREKYDSVKERLLELLLHCNSSIQELALCTEMKFVEAEGLNPVKEIPENHMSFPSHIFEPLVTALLSRTKDLTSLIRRFQEFLEYDDVRYFTMKFVLQDIKRIEKDDITEIYLSNVYAVLENLSMPLKQHNEPVELKAFISKLPENQEKVKPASYKEHKKLFTTLWLEFLKIKLPTKLYKKVLLAMHDKIIPHMTSPLLLSDFLTDSYNIGGAISLLALNGLFILVNTYNLNYPDFYEKLYVLFEPGIFHVKYRARFFFLADLFLTSTLKVCKERSSVNYPFQPLEQVDYMSVSRLSPKIDHFRHLPAYLVAAFAKRLSRLSLCAPPHCLIIMLPFLHNLLVRHPSCQVLINRPGVSEFESDPFLMEEQDLSKCKAMESSLWEVKCLQSHFHPTIATEAKHFSHRLDGREVDLGALLETTISDLFEKEVRKKVKEVPLTFNTTPSLSSTEVGFMSELWTVS